MYVKRARTKTEVKAPGPCYFIHRVKVNLEEPENRGNSKYSSLLEPRLQWVLKKATCCVQDRYRLRSRVENLDVSFSQSYS